MVTKKNAPRQSAKSASVALPSKSTESKSRIAVGSAFSQKNTPTNKASKKAASIAPQAPKDRRTSGKSEPTGSTLSKKAQRKSGRRGGFCVDKLFSTGTRSDTENLTGNTGSRVDRITGKEKF